MGKRGSKGPKRKACVEEADSGRVVAIRSKLEGDEVFDVKMATQAEKESDCGPVIVQSLETDSLEQARVEEAELV